MITKRKIIAWSVFALAAFIALYPFASVDSLIKSYPSVEPEIIAKFYWRGFGNKWYYSAFAVILFFIAMTINKDED